MTILRHKIMLTMLALLLLTAPEVFAQSQDDEYVLRAPIDACGIERFFGEEDPSKCSEEDINKGREAAEQRRQTQSNFSRETSEALDQTAQRLAERLKQEQAASQRRFEQRQREAEARRQKIKRDIERRKRDLQRRETEMEARCRRIRENPASTAVCA